MATRYISVVNRLCKGLNGVSTRYAAFSSTTPADLQEDSKEEKIVPRNHKRKNNILQTSSRAPKLIKFKTSSLFLSDADRTIAKQKELESRLTEIQNSISLKKVLWIINQIIKEKDHIAINSFLVLGLKRLNELYKAYESNPNTQIVLNLDKHFSTILIYIEENVKNMTNNECLSCFESLSTISSAEKCSHVLQNHLLSILSNLPIHHVIYLYRIILKTHEHHLLPNFRTECKDEIIRRCEEITRTEDIVTVIQQTWARDGKLFVDVLEGKFVRSVNDMSVEQLISVLEMLSKDKFRHVLVIQSILNNLANRDTNMTAKQIQQVIKSCRHLSIYNPKLLGKLSSDLLTADLSNKSVCLSLLSLFSRIRWCQRNVITVLMDSLVEKSGNMSPMVLTQLLLSSSYLNFCPEDKLELLHSYVMDAVSNDKGSPAQHVKMVWALTVLKGVSSQMVSSILDEGFCQKLKKSLDSDSWILQNCQWKLRNIECAAMCDLQNYRGPHLPPDYQVKTELIKSKHCSLTVQVLNVLKAVFPEKYKTDIISSCGYKIDAELLINQNGEVIEYTDKKKLPENVYRLAIKVLDFHSLILPDCTPEGPQVMAIRHLVSQGYKVIDIRCNDWSKLKSKEERGEYIRTRIKNSVQ